MDDALQARAYAEADFEAPQNEFIRLFQQRFPKFKGKEIPDLGCGPGDISRRFALAYPSCVIAAYRIDEIKEQLGGRLLNS